MNQRTGVLYGGGNGMRLDLSPPFASSLTSVLSLHSALITLNTDTDSTEVNNEDVARNTMDPQLNVGRNSLKPRCARNDDCTLWYVIFDADGAG